MQGKIQVYNADRGFGFIRPDHKQIGQRDVFFHVSQVNNGTILAPGDVVEFEHGAGKDGRPCAINVQRIARTSEGGPVRFGE